VLNLDAEDELRVGPGYTPPRATRARIAALVPRLATLVGADAVLVDPDGPPPPEARGLPGAAWCPTPRALRALTRAGAIVPVAPPVDVLRAVNHRRFSCELGPTLPGARWAASLSDVDAALASPCPEGLWLLKRPLGYTGRGRLRVSSSPSASERARIEASLREDGLAVEPWVRRDGDFALHGLLAEDGSFRLGAPTRLLTTEDGAWLGSERAPDGALDDAEVCALRTEGERVAHALHAAGYHGPFNVDAFRWRDEKDRKEFDPRCEINARFSMGWAAGIGTF